MSIKDVVSLYHGQPFRNGHWYTFHCPHCNLQVVRVGNNPTQKCACGSEFKWPRQEETGR